MARVSHPKSIKRSCGPAAVRRGLRALVGIFALSNAGGAAMIFGLGTPVTVGLVGAAVDYSLWSRQVRLLQNAADAAAIGATVELSVAAATPSRVQAIADSVVRSQLTRPDEIKDLVVQATLQGSTGVRVILRQPKRVYLSRIISPVQSDLEVGATAAMSGKRKVCVIALDPAKSGAIMLDVAARLTGGDCAIHSNSSDGKGFAAKSSSVVTAPFICSSGGYEGGSGNFSGPRLSDCPPIPDPLLNRPAPYVGPCKAPGTKLVIETSRTLTEGTYCEGIEIKKGAYVTFSPGIYVIKNGTLKVDDNATLYGRNVGIYFTGTNANFDFLSSATINLGAPKDGDMAGILFYGDRNADSTREYKITSDNARMLLGTIYIPQGFLTVNAKSPVADQAAYTAIVARRIELKESPNLVLNSNYAGTDVPVPKGLAPNADIRLVN